MSFTNPAFQIPRRSVSGEEAEWTKMFDPPTASPPTPELLVATNPVPEFMAATIPGTTVVVPHTVRRDLLRRLTVNMWDGKPIAFFTIGDPDVAAAAGGAFPGPTTRVPRGAVFHCLAAGKTPPHTVHWHGIEPSALNDGVGHCSFEFGSYLYQFQPNFIGSYFYHCHRNTVQHFEYGLYGFLIIEPPDAYDQQNPALPNYAGGYPRRSAANLTAYPQFPGFVAGDLAGGDPHAMTVPYDVEALWVIDDIDSVWRTLAPNAKETYPTMGLSPGVDDHFFGHGGAPAGTQDFFAFHDYNPDYFVVTGVSFPGPVGGTAAIAPGITVPRELNSGVSGMQVSVNAQVGQTVLIRILCAAYVDVKVTLPVDAVCIAWDGRALGVPPYGQYNWAYQIPAGQPIGLSTARRCDVLVRSSLPVDDFADAEFINNRNGQTLFHGRIPIVIT